MTTRHPFLRDDMSRFISTVTRARISAAATPPRYVQAGRVSGACANCHQIDASSF